MKYHPNLALAVMLIVDFRRTRYPAEREYTLFSPQGRNGFRLDHAFGSPRFASTVRVCRYDHPPRLEALSDHSALLVEFEPTLQGALGSSAVSRVRHLRLPRAPENPGCRGLLKIGKDQRWPQRLRQAQSHTPRGMREVGRWAVPGSTRSDLAAAERQVLAMFEPEPSCPEREWIRTTASEALTNVTDVFGTPLPRTDPAILLVYDDWRDWERPRRSPTLRHLWIGSERQTG